MLSRSHDRPGHELPSTKAGPSASEGESVVAESREIPVAEVVLEPTHDVLPGVLSHPRASQSADEQITQIIGDNDVRLWYITKYGQGKFSEEHLTTLVTLRKRFRDDPGCSLTEDEEVEYRKATMAATEFLGNRRPEAIRLFARVQSEQASSPLRIWLWYIGVVLLLALFSNGYQTLIGSQIERMKDARTSYHDEATQLSLPSGSLANKLSRMCELTLVYRAAASHLAALLNPLDSLRNARNMGLEAVDSSPGVCQVIRTGTIHPVDAQDEESHIEFLTANKLIIDNASKAEFATLEQRAVRLQAELVENLFSLFLMPMLYALLGALTSAVRAANEAFKSMTLTRVDGISLGARVLLGVVGGATIGIVFSEETLNGAGGLTVLGLAFAVGYAVDLFFNLLDAVKVGLGGPGNKSLQSR